MKTIDPDRILQRETACFDRRRPICIELHPRDLVLRLKGTRQRWTIPYDSIYWTAIKAEAERERLNRSGRPRRRD